MATPISQLQTGISALMAHPALAESRVAGLSPTILSSYGPRPIPINIRPVVDVPGLPDVSGRTLFTAVAARPTIGRSSFRRDLAPLFEAAAKVSRRLLKHPQAALPTERPPLSYVDRSLESALAYMGTGHTDGKRIAGDTFVDLARALLDEGKNHALAAAIAEIAIGVHRGLVLDGDGSDAHERIQAMGLLASTAWGKTTEALSREPIVNERVRERRLLHLLASEPMSVRSVDDAVVELERHYVHRRRFSDALLADLFTASALLMGDTVTPGDLEDVHSSLLAAQSQARAAGLWDQLTPALAQLTDDAAKLAVTAKRP